MKTIITFTVMLLTVTMMSAHIIYVPGDYQTIQGAIIAANPGDTILVADGIYYEQINFLGKKPLNVSSHFLLEGDLTHISNTIIDGSLLSQPDSASVVYFVSGEDTTSVLCGFTIRNGKGTHATIFNDLEGGGIWISGSGARIKNNRISGNKCEVYATSPLTGCQGGGIGMEFMENPYWVIIENNVIDSNIIISQKSNGYCDGGGISAVMNVRIMNNTIINNISKRLATSSVYYSSGGGLCAFSDKNWGGHAIISGNIISGNTIYSNLSGGGGVCVADIEMTFINNVVSGNSVGSLGPVTNLGGGGLVASNCQGNSLIANNRFENNESASWSGGLNVSSSSDNYNWMRIENNIFYNNYAEGWGGAIGVMDCPVRFENNVFSHNHATYGGIGYIERSNNYPAEHGAIMINNTFAYNTASYYNGGLNFTRTNPLLFNCLFWKNEAPFCNEIMVGTGYAELAYSNIDTNEVVGSLHFGPGIINLNPIFDDTLLLIPQVWGACIDAGIDNFICIHDQNFSAPAYDMLGNPRPTGIGIDQGAYDQIYMLGMEEQGKNLATICVFPNPFQNETTLTFNLTEGLFVKLAIFNQFGEQVGLLVDEYLPIGQYQAHWNAFGLASGVYSYRFQSGKNEAGGKLVVLTSGRSR